MITDVLQSIYTVANTVYAQVKLVQANQAQCKRLAERITIILAAVKNLEKVKEKDAAQSRCCINNKLRGIPVMQTEMSGACLILP